MIVSGSLSEIYKELPPNVKLVAVSKFKPAASIMEAYNAGQRDFAESRPQELKDKISIMPKDITWHFIGHLQANKIKMIIEDVSLIHSVDTLRLAIEIDKEASKRSLVKDCLIQIHIAKEETKQGFSRIEIMESIEEIIKLKNIRVCGLMGMASFVDDEQQIRREFSTIRELFQTLKQTRFINLDYFKEISMGMSSDYKIAIQEGSTIVRIGSKIFGDR
jgi:pyridoxal phosphate enzyme (YggS family)